MAEFHMLPSLKRESELITIGHHPNNDDDDDNNNNNNEPYDEYERWIIQRWDMWNEQAIQRTIDQSKITTATMPSLDHLTYQDFQNVYEPSDDTYLLLDAIQYDLSSINHHLQESYPTKHHDTNERNDKGIHDSSNDDAIAPICLEIGCGSGVVSVYFRTYWLDQERRKQKENSNRRRTYLISYVTDINPKALQITSRTFQQAMKCVGHKQVELMDASSEEEGQQHQNTISRSIEEVEYLLCDIASPLLHRLHRKVSYIICNPPYVPSCDSEVGQSDITAAYAGGQNGRRIIDRIIPQIVQLLDVPKGVAYFVTVDENLPIQLAIQMYRYQQREQVKQTSTSTRRILQMKPFFRKRAKNEFLTIQKITYIDHPCDDVNY